QQRLIRTAVAEHTFCNSTIGDKDVNVGQYLLVYRKSFRRSPETLAVVDVEAYRTSRRPGCLDVPQRRLPAAVSQGRKDAVDVGIMHICKNRRPIKVGFSDGACRTPGTIIDVSQASWCNTELDKHHSYLLAHEAGV